MMSEKRFERFNDVIPILKCDDDELFGLDEIVARLNQLYDENRELRQLTTKTEEEKEQLRKELYECEKDYLIETSDEVDRALYVDDELKKLADKYGVGDE